MVLAVINEVTGFMNSTISLSGTIICSVGFFIAILAIIIFVLLLKLQDVHRLGTKS